MRTGAFTLTLLAALTAAAAEQSHEQAEAAEAAKNWSDVASHMGEAKVPLAQGVAAAEKEGKPISAKFEMEGSALQLSVYVQKADAFSEVVVDHKTGQIVKSEAITGGEDLSAAKKQSAAMAKTKHSLREAIAAAEKGHAGYKVVSALPEIEHGKAQADMVLLKGTATKHIDQKL
jgi:hypothetical protein